MTLPELFDDLQISYLESGHKHCRNEWVQVEHCPFCGSDNYHLGINVNSNAGSCWRCGKHSLYELLIASNVEKRKAWALYKSLSGGHSMAVEAPRTGLVEPKGRGPLLPAHKRYLASRGFDWEVIQATWGIEGIGLHPNLGWRIYIPILQKKRRVSWTTRSISPDAEQRYISASAGEEAVNHKHLVHGAHLCQQTVIALEGPTDGWAVGPGAGVLFGTAFTSAQVLRLSEFAYRYICFDNSREAQDAADDLCRQLALFPGVTENICLNAEDPGSASDNEIRKLRAYCNL